MTSVSTDPTTQATAPAAPSRRWWTLATVALAQLMVVLDATVVNIALPAAQADLGFTDGQRQWIITAYSLAFGSLLLLGGRLSDLWGRKRTFILGLIGFALASAIGGAAPTFEVLVGARALQGAFGALLAPTALAVLTTTFTIPKERARAFGVFGAIAGAGGAIGLLLGGFLTEQFNWRWNLYINVFIAIVAIVGTILFVRHVARTGPRPKLDLPGTAFVSGALFLLVYGFSNAEAEGWDSPLTWGMLVASGVLLALFVVCSASPPTRSCRCRSCSTATAAPRSSRCSSRVRACSASSCSSRTTCRRRSATRPSRPGSRSCR
jgi:MFS family permease